MRIKSSKLVCYHIWCSHRLHFYQIRQQLPIPYIVVLSCQYIAKAVDELSGESPLS